MSRPRAWLSWSTGKDSAFALHQVHSAGELDVVGLLTTVDAASDRVAMHGVRRELAEAQARSLGLPLHVVELPWPCPNQVYEQRMRAAVDAALAAGVTHMVFGDLFLDDVRSYREQALAGSGLTPVFPLWERPTTGLAHEMLDSGLRAVLTCVDSAQLPASFAGRWFDPTLLADLPPTADPCGENGEFHTLVVDGPGFADPLDVVVGGVSERDGFARADVLPATV